MNLLPLFLSFRGRATRAGYWLGLVVIAVVGFLQLRALELEFFSWLPDSVLAWSADNHALVGVASLIASVVAAWAWLAVQVKR